MFISFKYFIAVKVSRDIKVFQGFEIKNFHFF